MHAVRRLSALACGVAIALIIGFLWNGHVVRQDGSGFVTEAQAIIGRPLTPLSYAGVARRTVRRCAVGVYYC